MSKRTILSQNTSRLISSLLNLDVSALQTTDIAQCREPIWELRQTQSKINSSAFHHGMNGKNDKAVYAIALNGSLTVCPKKHNGRSHRV